MCESTAMLSALKQSHEELLKSISELEAILSNDVIEIRLLAPARLQLSKASARRRELVAAAIQLLSEAASADELRRLDLLRDSNTAIAGATSRHVREWSTETIVANSEGYRAASAAMREAMRERIATERATLYPLLERAARR